MGLRRAKGAGGKCFTGTAVEEHDEVLWIFLQGNALSPAVSVSVASGYMSASSAFGCNLKTAGK